MSYNLTISEIKSFIEYILSEKVDFSKIYEEGFLESIDPNDRFMFLGDVYFDDEYKKIMNKIIISKIDSDNLMRNLTLLFYFYNYFSIQLLDWIYNYEVFKVFDPKYLVFLTLLFSDFIRNEDISKYCENKVSSIRFNNILIYNLLNYKWFIEFFISLRLMLVGTQNSKIIFPSNPKYYKDFITTIENGILFNLLYFYNRYYNDINIRKNILKYQKKILREEKLKKFYSYLGIANDIGVGLEFLIGSIEFLPSGNELLGVALFIVGSAQLLIRPMIKIARDIHLKILYKEYR
jgi:hypothetical protein